MRVRDVGRVEVGAQAYNTRGRLNGKPAAVVSVYQLPDTNAVAAADGVKKLMAELKQRFPQGLDYVISLDTTKPVTAGIEEMIKTLLEALLLVILVVYLFILGNNRKIMRGQHLSWITNTGLIVTFLVMVTAAILLFYGLLTGQGSA